MNSEARCSSAASALATGGSLDMTFDVDEEHIVPFALAGGARFDSRHIDPVFGQRLEQAEQRPRIIGVGGGHQQGGAVGRRSR